MVCTVITADKANRLYWLGRYVERVYISLNLLRRYYDKVIDGDIANLDEYYTFLGVDTFGKDFHSQDFQLAQLYDAENIYSIFSCLNIAKDNGITLRRDIKSESLCYIEASCSIIEQYAQTKESNITLLQLISDYMLAFFGSIDERVFNGTTRNLLKLGRLIENIDLHTRFHYPFFRIEEAFSTVKDVISRFSIDIDELALENLEALITEEKYKPENMEYRNELLVNLGKLVLMQ